MPIVNDIIEDMEARENQYGVVDYLRRKFYVSTDRTQTDATVMWACMQVPGLPNANDPAPGNPNLVCSGRQVRLLRKSKHQAEVICEYGPMADVGANFIFEGGTSLAQASTQVDKFGNQIALAHTWPENDDDFPSKTHLQGLDMNVLQPQTTLVASGPLPVAFPHWVTRQWVGSVNGTVWAGNDPYEWMCTRCDFKGLSVGFGLNRIWQFTFEFQHAITGWIPEAWFIDQRTGKPAVGVIPGIGIKQVDWYGVLDFSQLFPVTQ